MKCNDISTKVLSSIHQVFHLVFFFLVLSVCVFHSDLFVRRSSIHYTQLKQWFIKPYNLPLWLWNAWKATDGLKKYREREKQTQRGK